MAVTIKDVAREAGVSIGLVSMVVNGKDGVSPKTAKKVLSVIKKLGYKPNKAAASLRSGRKLTIGVITPDLRSSYFSDVSRQIENIAYKAGYTVLFGSSDDKLQKVEELIEIFAADGAGGLMITPCDGCESQVQRALDLGMPVVLLNRDLPNQKGVGRVMLDNAAGVRMAVDHLYASGRRHIEMVSNSVILSTLSHREVSYTDYMKELGLERFAHINYLSEGASIDEYINAVAGARDRGAEAILVPRGHLALDVFKAMNALGVKIPQDMALLGFDGGVSYTIASPEITQVDQNTYDTALEAFNMLSGMMEGGKPHDVFLAPSLKVGGSTAPLEVKVQRRELLLPGTLFQHRGGWSMDQQFMEQCGSTILLAHGLGKPVEDAWTDIDIAEDGVWHIWARSRNWAAPWTGKAAPGTFRLSIGSCDCPFEFGRGDSSWHWQEGGSVLLRAGRHRLTIHDLKGFDARFDSIYLALEGSNGEARKPSDDMNAMRSEYLALPEQPKESGSYDLVVAGGGVAGICAAIAAARGGLKVALIHDRMVLGGNNSSEVRVGLSGRINIGRYPSLGYLLNEFGPSRKGNPGPADIYEDARKMEAVLAEKNIDLKLGYRVSGVEKQGNEIKAVIATDVENYTRIRVCGRLFADCTGDSSLGVLAGADWRMGREGRAEYGEPGAPLQPDSATLGATIQWYSEDAGEPVSFPDIDWGMQLDDASVQKTPSCIEVGMEDDQILDAEKIRDYGMYLAYSNWSWLKNHASFQGEFSRSDLRWLCSVPGRKESRRLLGDLVLTENDLLNSTDHKDGCVSAYPLPYRCMYSRNVGNLFMAGHNISASHLALVATSTMRTSAMLGEVVGLAARVCQNRSALPRDVYEKWWDDLDSLMRKGAGRTDVPYQQVYSLE